MNCDTLQKEMLFPSAKTKHVKFKLCWKMEHCLFITAVFGALSKRHLKGLGCGGEVGQFGF
jgi:hypothetical protein